MYILCYFCNSLTRGNKLAQANRIFLRISVIFVIKQENNGRKTDSQFSEMSVGINLHRQLQNCILLLRLCSQGE